MGRIKNFHILALAKPISNINPLLRPSAMKHFIAVPFMGRIKNFHILALAKPLSNIHPLLRPSAVKHIIAVPFMGRIKIFHILALAKPISMSFVKIWVHLVFSTKNRHPWLHKEYRYKLQQHIIENCKEKDIFLQAINGYTDHIHCLISLGKAQSISKLVQLIKGESSYWINKQAFLNEPFSWQDDYFAVSVSESQVESVASYIKNQEKHHAKKSFNEEVNEFMTAYGWVVVKT
jgi:putative transposase